MRSTSKRSERGGRQGKARMLGKALGLSAAVVAATPLMVAATVVAVDLVQSRGRAKRMAPQPGVFEARVQESDLRIYTSGDDLYEDMLEAIDSAQDNIQMQAYIWKNDQVGQRFIAAFNAAADRGVTVHVIYDGFANLVVPRSFYRQLSSKIHLLRLPVIGRRFWKGPLRYTGLSHSKVLVVDHQIGFVGGYNIGSLYAEQWRDTHLREIGPAVWGLRRAVARLWNEDRAAESAIPWIAPHNWKPEVKVHANLPIQLVYPIRNMYLEAIEGAQDHIWVTTPYFIPDQQILKGLIRAADRGVDVRVMVPKASNHVIADGVSRGFYGQLLDAGITVMLYATSMNHAKTATIDGQWSTVGTANLDRLSLTYNYETNVEITDRGFAAEMEKVFFADSEHCEILTSPAWRDRHPMARFAEAALVPFRSIL